jgi:gluconate 2-dehydrogenase gamma chain
LGFFSSYSRCGDGRRYARLNGHSGAFNGGLPGVSVAASLAATDTMDMDRRTALNRISLLLGAAVSLPTASGFLAGCQAPPDGLAPRVLLPDAFRFVGQLAEVILPETDTPGALAAGVHGFIDTMMADYYPPAEAAAFQHAIDQLSRVLTRDGVVVVQEVVDLDAASYASAPPHREWGESFSPEQAFRRFKELVLTGFYTSEVSEGSELRPEPMGPWQGDAPLSEIGRSWA